MICEITFCNSHVDKVAVKFKASLFDRGNLTAQSDQSH